MITAFGAMAAALDRGWWICDVNFLAILVLLSGLLYGVVHFVQNYRMKSLLRKLPGMKPHPVYGDRALTVFNWNNDSSTIFFQVLAGYARMFQEEGLFLIWIGNGPYVFLFTPETLQPLLSSRTELEKGSIYRLAEPLLKTGLLTSSGEKWGKRRKFLTPAFHYEILGNFLPVFDEQSKVLVEILKEISAAEWIDISRPVTLCTLDIICETAMGVHLGAQKNRRNEYVRAVFDFLCIFAERRSKPWLWNEKLFSMTALGKKFNKTLKILTDFTKKAVNERKSHILEIRKSGQESMETKFKLEKKKRMALMDLLLTYNIDGQLTESDVCEEIDTFMFAGHDTTAVSIGWTLYNLGLHLDVQQKVYDELYDIFGEDVESAVTMDDVRKMKYLECVIKESLRIYPSAPMVSRHLKEDLKINGFIIPRGANVVPFIYGIHHNSRIYPNPEVFDPDRFLPENSVERHPYAFIPFSAGARNCIGQKFALLEEKTVIANVVRNFELRSLDLPDKVKFHSLALLKPGGDLRMSVTKRK